VLPAGVLRPFLLAATGNAAATFGQTFQATLDSSDVFFHRDGTAPRPRVDVARVTGPLVRVGGVVDLAATQSVPTTGGTLQIGTVSPLRITVTASTLENARLDSIRITGTGLRAPGLFVDGLTIALEGANARTLTTVANPFAAGSSIVVRNLNVAIAAGETVNLLVSVHVTDRLQQGESLALSADALFGTGLLSVKVAPATVGARSGTLAAANILQAGETFLVSENPVRDGAVIFTYATAPRSIAIYSFSGRKIREFTNLPANSITWNLRADSDAIPNGMYVVAADVGGKLVRQRLMILSPAR
jgi:hypothetical protein